MLVFNGEIYNYLSCSDSWRTQHGAVFATCEAILRRLITTGAPSQRLRGMFACLRCGTPSLRELFCARDPFGIVSIYRHRSGGTAVAREECLLDPSWRFTPHDRALQHYTVLQYAGTPRLHVVRRLESGYFAPDIRADSARRAGDHPLFRCRDLQASPDHQRQRPQPAMTRSRQCLRTRWLHSAPMSPSARFCPGVMRLTAIAAIRHTNPRPITFTTGFEREGFLRDR